MSFPRYPEYKDSGVEWLGEVPAHWFIKRLRFVGRLNPSKSEVTALPRDTEVSFIPMEAVGEDGSLIVDRSRLLHEVEAGYTYFRDGDVTIAKITPCFENGKGAVMRGLIGGIGFGTTELTVLRPDPLQCQANYLHWLFVSEPFRKRGEASMYGAGGQKRVPDDFIRDFAIGFPDVDEQTTIAAFLDRETAKIDALVAEQEKLIALLKEKRQAVISHAVTKGLDPNAPMKPSGIEWLGDVPAHWDITRMKFVVQDRAGIQMGPFGGMLLDLSAVDTGYKVYGQENTISGDFSLGGRWIAAGRFSELERYEILHGDIVLTRKGSLGNARLVPELSQRGIADSDTIRVRVKPGVIRGVFLCLVLHRSGYIAEQIVLLKRGAILAGINTETVSSLSIVLPGVPEQDEVIEYVDAVDREYGGLVDEANRAISLLKERRNALISAAVTGQIDVRNWSATENP